MSYANPQDFTGTANQKHKPELIKKTANESTTQFYERAEKQGIGRYCTQCDAKRRFSMVQCGVCLNYLHYQTEYKTPTNPIEGTPENTATEQRNKSHTSQDGNYSFEGNPEHQNPTPTTPTTQEPLENRSLKELQLYATQKGIDLPKSLRRNNVTKSKVKEYIEDSLGGIEPDKSPDVPIHDKPGHTASSQ